ncbi:MAG: TetR/AcrR family transcriptional regulator [Polyangiales bacterium]
MAPPSREKEQRRAQILAVATEVFAEKGYHDARIDDIVVGAGIARGTFYLYFSDKRAIFEELVDGFLARLDASIERIELTDNAPRHMNEIAENLRRVFARFAAEPAMARILLSAAVGIDADFDRKLLAFYDEVTAMLSRALTQGEAAGLVRPGNADLRAHCLTGALKECLHQLMLRRADLDPEALLGALLDLVADGLFTEISRSAAGRSR